MQHSHKKRFPTELAYLLGLAALALGVSLMERADFGVSMVVAPAYLVYRRLSLVLPWFTFGMAEYSLQAVLLVGLCLLLRRFRLSYLCSFLTAVLYGFLLDGSMLLVTLLPGSGIVSRLLCYLAGMLICSVGVSLIFHTYIAPEVYELFVKEVSRKIGMEISRFKTRYDCVSCLVGVVLSFLFFGFGHFVGVRWGTILCALINGRLIGLCSRCLEGRFTFPDALPWRPFFEDAPTAADAEER